MMKSSPAGFGVAVIAATIFFTTIFCRLATAQAPPTTIDGLVRTAKNAAGLEWSGTFLRLCIPPPPAPARGERVAAPAVPAARGGTPSKETWYAEPAKVADNLYFLGAEDWDSVDRSTNHAGGKPKHDIAGTNGMKISVGDASVQIVTMPGHTPGTLSFLFEVKDNGKPLRIAYVGGTAIPFNGDAAYYDRYIASSKKMAKAAGDFGATVLMPNHSEFDDAYFKAHTAAGRKPGEANPFDVGREAVARYFSVVQNCAEAAKLRAASQ